MNSLISHEGRSGQNEQERLQVPDSFTSTTDGIGIASSFVSSDLFTSFDFQNSG